MNAKKPAPQTNSVFKPAVTSKSSGNALKQTKEPESR